VRLLIKVIPNSASITSETHTTSHKSMFLLLPYSCRMLLLDITSFCLVSVTPEGRFLVSCIPKYQTTPFNEIAYCIYYTKDR